MWIVVGSFKRRQCVSMAQIIFWNYYRTLERLPAVFSHRFRECVKFLITWSEWPATASFETYYRWSWECWCGSEVCKITLVLNGKLLSNWTNQKGRTYNSVNGEIQPFICNSKSKLSDTHKYCKTVNFLSQLDASTYNSQTSKVTTVIRYCYIFSSYWPHPLLLCRRGRGCHSSMEAYLRPWLTPAVQRALLINQKLVSV